MSYEIAITRQFEEDLDRLSETTRERILQKLHEFQDQLNEYGIDPRHHNSTKFITGTRTWRLRIGDHRAFFDIENDTITLTTVLSRSQAYKD